VRSSVDLAQVVNDLGCRIRDNPSNTFDRLRDFAEAVVGEAVRLAREPAPYTPLSEIAAARKRLGEVVYENRNYEKAIVQVNRDDLSAALIALDDAVRLLRSMRTGELCDDGWWSRYDALIGPPGRCDVITRCYLQLTPRVTRSGNLVGLRVRAMSASPPGSPAVGALIVALELDVPDSLLLPHRVHASIAERPVGAVTADAEVAP